MKQKDIKCLVIHHNDSDGISAGAIVGHFEEGCIMHKINYGYETPWKLIKRAQKVYMVDFGLQPFSDMIKLKNIMGDNFIWIDHHKTAIQDMEDSGQTFKGIQEIGLAGCELTWKWFSQEPTPKLITMLGRYDVWDLDYHEDVVPIQTGFRFKDVDADNTTFWNKALEDDETLYDEILNIGKICYEFQSKNYKQYCQSHSFDIYWENYRFLAANAMGTGSQLFDSKFNHHDYDALLAFGFTHGHWTISLYTTKENVDLGSIAKKYGGGGHERAAGFQSTELPFELPYER